VYYKGRENCLDVIVVSEKHSQSVDAQTPASSWWQSILQSCAEILINKHGLIITSCLVLPTNTSIDKYLSTYLTQKYSLSINNITRLPIHTNEACFWKV